MQLDALALPRHYPSPRGNFWSSPRASTINPNWACGCASISILGWGLWWRLSPPT